MSCNWPVWLVEMTDVGATNDDDDDDLEFDPNTDAILNDEVRMCIARIHTTSFDNTMDINELCKWMLLVGVVYYAVMTQTTIKQMPTHAEIITLPWLTYASIAIVVSVLSSLAPWIIYPVVAMGGILAFIAMTYYCLIVVYMLKFGDAEHATKITSLLVDTPIAHIRSLL